MKYDEVVISPLCGIEINLGEEALVKKIKYPYKYQNDNILYNENNGFCKNKGYLIILRNWIDKIIRYCEELDKKCVNIIEAFEHMRKGKLGFFDGVAYTIINGDLKAFDVCGNLSKREITQEMITGEWEID